MRSPWYLRRAGRRKNNGVFLIVNSRGHIQKGGRHRPMSRSARMRFLRRMVDIERRSGWLPTINPIRIW